MKVLLYMLYRRESQFRAELPDQAVAAGATEAGDQQRGVVHL